jgi:hypothetical protein
MVKKATTDGTLKEVLFLTVMIHTEGYDLAKLNSKSPLDTFQ